MKKLVFLLLIGASFLKTSAQKKEIIHNAFFKDTSGAEVSKETIIDYIQNGENVPQFGYFKSKTGQVIKVYVVYGNFIEHLNSKLEYAKKNNPKIYPKDMTLEEVLQKLIPVSGYDPVFSINSFKNTGVNIYTKKIEAVYSDWAPLPKTTKNGTTIRYWSVKEGDFIDPWFKGNCGNSPFSKVIFSEGNLDSYEEAPQKEYATLPCDRKRIEMGNYDVENGITYGRFSADGRYHYLNRDGSWSELINGEWVKIICPEEKEAIIERKTVYKKTIIDTVFVKEYIQNNQTVYTFEQPKCNHQFNCNSGCNNQNQNVYYNQRDWGFGFNLSLSPDQRGERIVYRERPQQYRDQQPQQTSCGNSYPFGGGNQFVNSTSGGYPFGGGNNFTNTNNGSFDGPGTIYGVHERVGQ